MLSAPARRPNGKFVLGPPVETEAPIKVFTGPADQPDAVQTAEPRAKKKKHVAKKDSGEKTRRRGQDRQDGAGAKTASRAQARQTHGQAESRSANNAGGRP